MAIAITAQIVCLKCISDAEGKKLMTLKKLVCILLLPNLALMVNYFSI